MPKIILSEELDQIVELISSHQDGIGIDTLSQVMGGVMPRRTLQRRLALLIDQHRIQTNGEGRALRYLRTQQMSKFT